MYGPCPEGESEQDGIEEQMESEEEEEDDPCT